MLQLASILKPKRKNHVSRRRRDIYGIMDCIWHDNGILPVCWDTVVTYAYCIYIRSSKMVF